jgi:hypothetical protein
VIDLNTFIVALNICKHTPRFLFLITAIPLNFPLYWFKEMNKLFSDFLWSNKKQESATKDYPDQGKEVDWESQIFILIILFIMLGFLCCGPIQARVS